MAGEGEPLHPLQSRELEVVNASPGSFALNHLVFNEPKCPTRHTCLGLEKTCYRRRRKDALGRMTPFEYETINRTAFAA